MLIALASPRVASTLDEGLDRIRWLLSEASAQGAEIVCFPEAYLPGLRGQDFEVVPFDRTRQEQDQFYVPGDSRQLFEINGVKFGVAICHEGWRYPETVRWAAVRGAKIVFHPHHTGRDHQGVRLTQWGSASAPYYEKAMMLRGQTLWMKCYA